MAGKPEIRNLLDIPDDVGRAAESFEVLVRGPGVRVERIVSRGQITPEEAWYDQDEDEWVALLAGHATLRWVDDAGVETDVMLSTGDWLLIPAHRRHRVVETSSEPPCVWLAVHGSFGPPGAL